MIEISIYFDLETLPTDCPVTIAEIAADITAPARMTKAETIAAWEANERPAAILEAVSKTALDGGTGRLASVAFAIGDGPIECALALDDDGTPSREAEIWLIESFFAACEALKSEFKTPPIMVGHNVLAFDLRWLWKRSIVLGIEPPWWWPHNARQWDEDRVQDTMTMWEGPKGRISQDTLARRLSIRGKSGFDGSMVAAAWQAGEYDRIAEYNRDDVRCVREIHRMITGHRPAKPQKAPKPVVEAPPVDAAEGEQESMVCF